MSNSFPGPKTRQTLERGIPLFRNGLRFHQEMEKAGRRGFRSANQIVIDRAEGDFVWDMDGDQGFLACPGLNRVSPSQTSGFSATILQFKSAILAFSAAVQASPPF